MAKYLKLFMVALFATMSFALTSCGDDDDEPDGPDKIESTNSQYTFKFNNKTYYYGYKLNFANLFDLYQVGGYSLDDYSCFLSFGGQDTPLKYDKETGLLLSGQDASSDLDITINLDPFNPRTAKNGDVLSFKQAISSTGDRLNYIWYDEAANNTSIQKLFTLRSEDHGTVKFISYDKDEEILTLEFVNVKFDLYVGGYDYSDFADQSTQAVISGKVLFKPI